MTNHDHKEYFQEPQVTKRISLLLFFRLRIDGLNRSNDAFNKSMKNEEQGVQTRFDQKLQLTYTALGYTGTFPRVNLLGHPVQYMKENFAIAPSTYGIIQYVEDAPTII